MYIFIALLATRITDATRLSALITDLYFTPFFSAPSAAHDGQPPVSDLSVFR